MCPSHMLTEYILSIITIILIVNTLSICMLPFIINAYLCLTHHLLYEIERVYYGQLFVIVLSGVMIFVIIL
jgi:hypothetical protein